MLWGETPPPAAAGSLRNLVSECARALGDGRLITRGHGYLLRVADDELDAWRFEALLGGARRLSAGDPELAWRGCARPGTVARTGAGRSGLRAALQARPRAWRRLRLAALEERIEADLARAPRRAGRGTRGATREHPLRERLRGQQILALYRCGRQAEALEAYGRGAGGWWRIWASNRSGAATA